MIEVIKESKFVEELVFSISKSNQYRETKNIRAGYLITPYLLKDISYDLFNPFVSYFKNLCYPECKIRLYYNDLIITNLQGVATCWRMEYADMRTYGYVFEQHRPKVAIFCGMEGTEMKLDSLERCMHPVKEERLVLKANYEFS